jgi:hypothetical protein
VSDEERTEDQESSADEDQESKETQEAAGSREPEKEQGKTYPASVVEDLRSENAERRVKLRETEAELKQARLEHKKSVEALVAEKDAEIAELRVAQAVVSKAASMRFKNPEDALKLIDSSAVSFDDGAVTGVDEALQSLVEERAYLLAPNGKAEGDLRDTGSEAKSGSDWLTKAARAKAGMR